MNRKHKIILFSFLIIFTNCFNAQNLWQIALLTKSDYKNSIIQTLDSGYAVVGTSSYGSGANNIYVAKISSSGSLQWTKIIGGSGYDHGYSIIQLKDTSYIVFGCTNSYGHGGFDIIVLKLNSDGTLQWAKTVGGPDDDVAYSVIQTNDGGYALAGETNSFGASFYDIFIVKLDSNCMPQWVKTIGGAWDDCAYSIIQTTDGGYALAGITESFGMGVEDMYLSKIDSNGNFQWSRTIGGANDDIANSVKQTTDGGYLLVGYTSSFGAGQEDMYFVKLDSCGSLQWTKTMGGSNWDVAESFLQTEDGGYIVAGSSATFGNRICINKFNSNATLLWSKTVGRDNFDYAFRIIKTLDGGFAVSGITYSVTPGYPDMYIIKFDSSINTCTSTESPSIILRDGGTLGIPKSKITSPNVFVTTPVPTILSIGTIINICPIGIKPITNDLPRTFYLYQNYPNPFNPVTKIKFSIPASPVPSKGRGQGVSLKIYDILGREIASLLPPLGGGHLPAERSQAGEGLLSPGTYEVEFDGSNYPSGVYFYKLKIDDASSTAGGPLSITKKMVLLK